METISNELRDLGESSTVEISKAVYSCVSNVQDNRRSAIRGVSVGSQFKSSLQSLVNDLEETQPHYIRCIKPNLRKMSNTFSAGEVLKQLRYSGMMEAIRIRQMGYALREDHLSFYNRFSVLLSAEELGGDGGIEKLVQVISKRLKVTDADWQIGHSKIFIRRELSEKLERLAKLRVYAAARTLGRFGRGVAWRRLATSLVFWMRFRLKVLKKYRRGRASAKIAAAYRMHKQIQLYKSTIMAVVKIQSTQRQLSALQRARKLRDQFYGMTFKDLKQLFRSETSRMEEAVAAKDFRTAADLEARL
jgi:myosin heavy subunit